jgi:hypothetical protein
VSSQIDVFRRDLHIRGLRSTNEAEIKKSTFGQVQSTFLIKLKSNLINLFLCVTFFAPKKIVLEFGRFYDRAKER